MTQTNTMDPQASPAPSAQASTDQARFAQVTGTFAEGGAERLAHNLGIALSAAGMQSLAVAVRSAGAYAGLSPDGVEVVELGAKRKDPRSVVAAASRMKKLIRDRRINVLHVHGERSLPFCVLTLKSMPKTERPRLWFTWHIPDSILDDAWYWNRICVWGMRHCEKVFGASQAIVDRLNQERGLNASVFVNGVPEIAETTQRNADPPIILWQARIAPTKDPKALVKAAATLKREGLDFRIILAGSGVGQWEWYADEVKQMVRENDLEDRIEMPGWVDDIESLILSSSIGVQSSHFEGLSMSLLEQMMAGLAVVATDVGDTAVAVEHERTGLVVPPDDPDTLTDALRRVVSDASFRKELGAAARAKALKHYTLASMAERIASEYANPN